MDSKMIFKKYRRLILSFVRNLLIFAIGLLFCLVFYFIDQKKINQLVELRTVLALSLRQDEIAQALADDWKKIEPYYPKFKEAIPSTEQLPEILNILESTVTQTKNQDVFRISNLSPSSFSGISRLQFEQELNGNLNTFLDYLKALENLPFFVQIENISVVSNTTIDSVSKMRLSGVIFLK